jgi:hypothetical protein
MRTQLLTALVLGLALVTCNQPGTGRAILAPEIEVYGMLHEP